MTEHVAVAVDEVVLLEAVEDDGHAAVEHLGQARLWVAESTHRYRCISSQTLLRNDNSENEERQTNAIRKILSHKADKLN